MFNEIASLVENNLISTILAPAETGAHRSKLTQPWEREVRLASILGSAMEWLWPSSFSPSQATVSSSPTVR